MIYWNNKNFHFFKYTTIRKLGLVYKNKMKLLICDYQTLWKYFFYYSFSILVKNSEETYGKNER